MEKKAGIGWWVAVVVGGLCVLAGIGFFLFLCWQPLKYTQKSVSPGGGYTVTVKRSDGGWPFGPARVRVVARDGVFRRESYDTRIDDDGGRGAASVVWLEEDTAQVTLSGSEQKDEVLLVVFGEKIRIETEDPARKEDGEALSPEKVLELNVGDGAHKFWVELVETERYGTLLVNVYKEQTDREPIQTFEGSCENSFASLYLAAEDVDFDGYTDFAVLYGDAPNGNASFSYYIWEENEEKFIPDPYGLNGLFSVGLPEFLPEEKTVRTVLRWGAGREGEARNYRYLEEGFTCVRQMSWRWREDGSSADFLVENYENGEMRTVYEETCSAESLGGDLWSEEFSDWYDPDHQGEQ